MARVPSIRDCCTSKLPPGLMSHNKGPKVLSFCFFWQMRLLLSCCRSVNQEACLGIVWSGTRSGCTINHYQFSSSFLFFSFVGPNVRHLLNMSCLSLWSVLNKLGSSGRDVSDWLPLPRPAVCRLVRTGPPFVQLLWPCPKTEPVRLRLYFLCTRYCISTAGYC
jgi:hypothetical protein